MTTFRAGDTTGVVAYAKPEQTFRFVRTSQGDIFVPSSLVSGREDKLVQGAQVSLSYWTGQKGLVAGDITSVLPPLEPEFLAGEVKFFDQKKGYGFIVCETLLGKEVFLHKSTAREAGVLPWEGMSLEFYAVERNGKLRAEAIRPLQEVAEAPKPKRKKSSKASEGATTVAA